MVPSFVTRYLERRCAEGPWKIEGSSRRNFRAAVVIPALAESNSLFETLEHLAQNPPELLRACLVLVVVNHRRDSALADRQDNLKTLERLRRDVAGGAFAGLNLGWVDAANPGGELPEKGGGVGLARKIGFDLALSCLDYSGKRPFLVALDADTLVRPDYVQALTRHFDTVSAGGAVIPYRHQPGAGSCEQAAIDRYELFLRSHQLGLALAGSPYAFHTIGSTMACSAEAYVRMGGMNRRQAGEDFYFLQQLAKTAGIATVEGTEVYPSARPSSRTPFGTGCSVARLMDGDAQAVLFYPEPCFRVLERWLQLVQDQWDAQAEVVLQGAQNISEILASHLRTLNLPQVWERLRKNHPRREGFLRAFHGWFDGLQTMRLIHALCDNAHPRCEPQQVLPALMRWAGLPEEHNGAAQLARLRGLQNGVSEG